MDSKKTHYVYFIKADNYVKVGNTKNIEKRMVSLQTGNVHKLELLHAIEINGSFEEALKLEKEIHNYFKEFNINGEWFKLTWFIKQMIEGFKKGKTIQESEDVFLENYEERYNKIIEILEDEIRHDLQTGNKYAINRLRKDFSEAFKILERDKQKDKGVKFITICSSAQSRS